MPARVAASEREPWLAKSGADGKEKFIPVSLPFCPNRTPLYLPGTGKVEKPERKGWYSWSQGGL